MKKNHKKAVKKLYETADGQQGFFTTQQALAAGFAENTHPYHVQAGNWIREYRGIYRLAQFPQPEHPDLTLWSLWSRNRQGIIEGVYSHQTALSLYDLSDLMPGKLHMTVPKHFRRNSVIPKILVLHYGDMPTTDTERLQGVRVARPLRALADLLAEGQISMDSVEQAARQAIRRGLITRAQIEKGSLPHKQKAMLLELVRNAA